jgi:hypothetical protein
MSNPFLQLALYISVPDLDCTQLGPNRFCFFFNSSSLGLFCCKPGPGSLSLRLSCSEFLSKILQFFCYLSADCGFTAGKLSLSNMRQSIIFRLDMTMRSKGGSTEGHGLRL